MRAVGVALFAGVLTYKTPFYNLSTVSDYWTSILDVEAHGLFESETLVLFVLLFLKIFLTVLSVGFSGIPAGVFGPLIIIGAMYGRLIGELTAYLFDDHDINISTYTFVGAAALSSGVTQTISSVVILVELTYQSKLLMPFLISCLCAIYIAKQISPSVYDALVLYKGLPVMPRFSKLRGKRERTAQTIMNSDVQFFTLRSTLGDLKRTLAEYKFKTFPVVESADTMVFLGSVERTALENLVWEANKIEKNTTPVTDHDLGFAQLINLTVYSSYPKRLHMTSFSLFLSLSLSLVNYISARRWRTS